MLDQLDLARAGLGGAARCGNLGNTSAKCSARALREAKLLAGLIDKLPRLAVIQAEGSSLRSLNSGRAR